MAPPYIIKNHLS